MNACLYMHTYMNAISTKCIVGQHNGTAKRFSCEFNGQSGDVSVLCGQIRQYEGRANMYRFVYDVYAICVCVCVCAVLCGQIRKYEGRANMYRFVYDVYSICVCVCVCAV
jgi:hypothetical protein